MIEIVYKENKEQANGNEGYFHLPKNIRQIGDTDQVVRLYVEDYVNTYLKRLYPAGNQTLRVGLLLGLSLIHI